MAEKKKSDSKQFLFSAKSKTTTRFEIVFPF